MKNEMYNSDYLLDYEEVNELTDVWFNELNMY